MKHGPFAPQRAGMGESSSAAAGAHAARSRADLPAALWFAVGSVAVVAWMLATRPIVCPADQMYLLTHPCAGGGAERRLGAAVVVTAGYALLALVGTVAGLRSRSSRPFVRALVAAILAAVPAWLWVAAA